MEEKVFFPLLSKQKEGPPSSKARIACAKLYSELREGERVPAGSENGKAIQNKRCSLSPLSLPAARAPPPPPQVALGSSRLQTLARQPCLASQTVDSCPFWKSQPAPAHLNCFSWHVCGESICVSIEHAGIHF